MLLFSFLTLELQQHGREPLLAKESEWNGDPLFLHGHLSSLSAPLCLSLIITVLCMSDTVNAQTTTVPDIGKLLAGRVLQSGSMFGHFGEALTA